MGKLPAILLYDGDWYKDGVAGCCLGAQGLWLRMMFIGHNSERYGYLQVNGLPIPPESIARRCGCTLEEYEAYLLELDRNGVPSRTPEGIIYSRRLVKDAAARASGASRQQRKRNKEKGNANITPRVTPLSVDVNESQVVEVGFDLQGFNFEEFYEKLLKIYPKFRRSALIEQLAMQAVEKMCQLHSFRRPEAANYILKKTQMYVEMKPVQFQEKFDAFLRDMVFDQKPEAWEQVVLPSNRPDMAIGARRDGPWTQEEYEAQQRDRH